MSLTNFPTLCFEEWKMNPGHGPMVSLTSSPAHVSPSHLFFNWGIADMCTQSNYTTPAVSTSEMPSEPASFHSFPTPTVWGEKPLFIYSQVIFQFLVLLRAHLISPQILVIINHISPSGNSETHLIVTAVYFNTWFSKLSLLKNVYPNAKLILMGGVHHWLYLLNQETHFSIPTNNLESIFIS